MIHKVSPGTDVTPEVAGWRYLSFKTSPLEYTITPGENHITVEIEPDGGH